MSIKIEVVGILLQRLQRLLAVRSHGHRVPVLFQQAKGDQLIYGVVLGKKNAQAVAALAQRMARHKAGGVSLRAASPERSEWRPRVPPAGRVWSDRQRRPVRGSACASPRWPAELSIITVAASQSGFRLMDSAERESVHFGHLRVEQYEREDSSQALGLAQRNDRIRAAIHRMGSMCQLSSILTKICRLVALSSTTRTPMSRNVLGSRGTIVLAGRLLKPKVDGEMKTAALPKFAFHPDSARPSVPPAGTKSSDPARCRRTCESSSRRLV